MTLEALDASCTEAWLHITPKAGVEPLSIIFRRDTTTVLTTTLVSPDTMAIDEGLLPGRSCTYTLTRPAGVYGDRLSASMRTMDTTSHDGYTWSMDTLGVGNSSALLDAGITNDTLAYAVGRMSLRDSSGQFDPTAYSFAVWRGTSWQSRRTYYAGNNLIVPIRGIARAGANHIRLSAGRIFHGDGVSSQAQLSFSRLTLPDPNGTVEKLWISTGAKIFGFGDAGTIVRFNGNSWAIHRSGTTVSLRDVTGSPSGTKVWAAGQGATSQGT